MFALVLAAALMAPPAPAPSTAPAAAAGPETPIPGTWMRLGDTEGRILQRAQFPVAEGPKTRGVVMRQGPANWFGIAGKVMLHFRDERLDQAEFRIEDVAPYWLDYIRDQMRLAGYSPECEEDEPTLQLCDWVGAAHVRTELRDNKLLARITPAEPGAVPVRQAVPGTMKPRPARPDTVPIFPQIFVLGRGAPAGVTPPALADSTPLLSPPYPPRARAAGVQGRVWVRALVDTSGAVEAAEILRSIPELDSAAVAVARSCRFRPYPPEGPRVRFRVEIPVKFTEH